MALVAIQCKNCGGALQVDSAAKSYYCPHCQTSYAMEQTITQNIQNTNIGNIERATIIDDGSGKIDQEIYGGEALLTLRKYDQAREVFERLTAMYAHKHRAWWGLARATTEDFTRDPYGKSEFDCVCESMNNAVIVAPEGEKAQLEESRAAYIAKWQGYHDQLTNERSQRLAAIEQKTNALLSPHLQKLHELEETVAQKARFLSIFEKVTNIVPIAIFLLFTLIVTIIYMSEGGGLIGSIFMSAIACAFAVLLPVKIIFFLIGKAVVVPSELMINHTNKQIEQVMAEVRYYRGKMQEECSEVYRATQWLDH